MPAPLQLRFVMSARDVAALPPTSAEVAVVGRSNVGKSSLINALANQTRLAHTSKTPGRTQLLNLFEVRTGGTVMDLPGYGYAAVSGRARSTWPAMIEGYLTRRDELTMVLVLVDGEIGPTKLDLGTLEWLRDHELPYAVVATKQDKVKASHRIRRQKEVAAACGIDDVPWVSSTTKAGIDHLRGLISGWLASGRTD